MRRVSRPNQRAPKHIGQVEIHIFKACKRYRSTRRRRRRLKLYAARCLGRMHRRPREAQRFISSYPMRTNGRTRSQGSAVDPQTHTNSSMCIQSVIHAHASCIPTMANTYEYHETHIVYSPQAASEHLSPL